MTSGPLDATWEIGKALIAQIPGVSLSVDLLDRMEGLRQAEQVQEQLRVLRAAIEGLAQGSPLGPQLTSLLESLSTAARNSRAVSAGDQLDMLTARNVLLIIELLNTSSVTGRSRDPMVEPAQLAERLVIEGEDAATRLREVAVIVEELSRRGLVIKDAGSSPVGFVRVSPSERFFAATDQFFQAWDPADDAITVAIVISRTQQGRLAQLAADLGWDARRLNPAVQVLLSAGAVYDLGITYSEPFLRDMVLPTSATDLHARRSQRSAQPRKVVTGSPAEGT
jgi:hypothetical protein